MSFIFASRVSSVLRPLALGTLSALVLASPALAQSKKELAQKVVNLQQADVEALGRAVVEQPLMRLMQDAGQVLQTQVPEAKRESVAKAIDGELRAFVEAEAPVAAQRAKALAPSVMLPALEEKFTEDELKAVIAWMESPASKKFAQFGPEVGRQLGSKVAQELAPSMDPKFNALAGRVRTALGVKEAAPTKPAAQPKKK